MIKRRGQDYMIKRRDTKWHTHKDDSDAIVVDFMPMPLSDDVSNNYRRRHGERPVRYGQEIRAIQREVRSEAKNYKGLL